MLWRALGLVAGTLRVVTLVGAGGKTTLLYKLAAEHSRDGHSVLITTTTHIQNNRGLPAGNVSQEGRTVPGDKLAAGRPIDWCREQAELVLVEGDGAHGLPLKAPEDWEPVIPPESDAVICVAGLTAVGARIGDCCHRWERVCALLGKLPTDRVTPSDVVTLLTHPMGGRKGTPVGAQYRYCLNQGDDPKRAEVGSEIAWQLEKQGVFGTITAFAPRERGLGCWF